MTEQWQELKETITEMRDNDGTGTQQETCKFLADYMEVLEKQMQQPCEDCISRAEAIEINKKYHGQMPNDINHQIWEEINALPSVQPKPMQVELEGDGYSDGKLVYDYGKCPKCGWEFEYDDKDWEEPYCCHCGQKLHWFESEE